MGVRWSRFLSTACGHVGSDTNCVSLKVRRYQHQSHIFQSRPEEKWALAGRAKTIRLFLAFPRKIAAIPEVV